MIVGLHAKGVDLRPSTHYAHLVRPSLPPHAFEPVRSRLVWLAFHVAVIAAGIVALRLGWGGRWVMPLYALAIGSSFAGCAFVGHETMHGAVVRARGWRYLVGWICFLPFTLSPRLWVAWHNKTHHGNTMSATDDPDAYPTLDAYRRSRAVRVADFFAFGAGRPAGFLTLLLGFTGQSTQMLLRWSRTSGVMSPRARRLAIAETLAGVAVWIAVLWLLGPLRFLFAFVVPLMIGNAIVIAYILTNHSLSPLTDVNDPLVNSLTVTVPRPLQWLHLNFGLHVEHHLFPSMSSAFAPLVRGELQARWPDRYQSMSLWAALARLARTPRVYASATQLHDPRTGKEAPTLQPSVAPPTATTPEEPVAEGPLRVVPAV